jgi:hypothetical protein
MLRKLSKGKLDISLQNHLEAWELLEITLVTVKASML